MKRIHRRTVLLCTGIGIAGCLGNDGDEDDDSGEHRGPMAGETPISTGFPIRLYEADTGDIGPDLHWHGDEDDVSTHWHRSPLEVAHDSERIYEVVVHDPEGQAYDIGADIHLEIAPTETEYLTADLDEELFTVTGEETGEDELTFTIVGDGGDWETPALPIAVTE